jgi:integrase
VRALAVVSSSGLADDYLSYLEAGNMHAIGPTASIARVFFERIGPHGWSDMSLEQQCTLAEKYRRIVGWLIVTRRVTVTPDYLVRVSAYLGGVGGRVYPSEFAEFLAAGEELGYDRKSVIQQWSVVAKTAGIFGLPFNGFTNEQFDAARGLLLRALGQLEEKGLSARTCLSRDFYRAGATLFHLGWLKLMPLREVRNQRDQRAAQWASAAPLIARRFTDYVEQMRASLRPSTVNSIERALREFATFLRDQAPEVTAIAEIKRTHIEAFKLHLMARTTTKGSALNRHTIAQHLGALATCFERLLEWGGDDLPSGVLIFSGDFPIRDEPLPRFLDDASFSKLLSATRVHPDPFTRLCVETLARTGMRKGEFLALTDDAIVQIGSSYWLRVPIGKLHNDRYIPLHPDVKILLDTWIANRPPGLRTHLLFTTKGRPIAKSRVDKAVAQVARDAGVGHVTAHQLRHTLATQAINRGMSLEAIAALLGHRSMRMTMVYARIADRTVADEYFSVSAKVEALYDSPKKLPSDAEGLEMRKLRSEMSRRLLGNGYCVRPVELDCHYELICESCTSFITTIEFRPTLQRQCDDAEDRGQLGRQKIFNALLERLDDGVAQ